jgi:hypothetical protein
MSEAPNTGFSRRAFLKLAGVAAALATGAGTLLRRVWAGGPARGASDQRPASSDPDASTDAQRSVWGRFTDCVRVETSADIALSRPEASTAVMW